ncbi:site-2 protease family protein [candidate division KSB3 bacterium]|uniref:Site-2 protease family protein n=1 Tax=candidate division KSB3 bacterium TaxID=2044937 RepID=A0A9D5Q6J5_9BACT|nr:site-2 protease family protein [candidate division KSB3 bacterium]MBD3325919.1 site-2 protease family protein [candidate division KSB3 bacterium]
MKHVSLGFWLIVPLGIGVLYPYVKEDAQILGGLTIGLLIYTLFFSVVVHELCHGLAAYWCGDTTAKEAGRLTCNPIRHISVFGTILVPLVLYLLRASVIFGWAKPVPFHPVNLREHPRDQVMVAVAGSLSNFTLSYLCFLLYLIAGMSFNRLFPESPISVHWEMFSPLSVPSVPLEAFWFVLFEILSFGMVINVILGVFNLIPFPPLDGSWILKALLPKKATVYFGKIQLLGFILLLLALQFRLLEIFFYPAIILIGVYQVIAGFCLG